MDAQMPCVVSADSDELPPAEILRQAQELGVKASMMSAAQSDLVHVQLPGVVHFALPEVPSLLPSGTGPPEEARATGATAAIRVTAPCMVAGVTLAPMM